MRMFKNIKEYLKTNSEYSLMRLMSLSMVWTVCIYIFAIVLINAVYVCLGTEKGDLIDIDWYGAATFATAALAGKYAQKTSEKKDKVEEKSGKQLLKEEER